MRRGFAERDRKQRMKQPLVPFGVWIAGLTLAGGAAWFAIFALAFVEGGPCFFVAATIAVLVAPCYLVYLPTKHWPHQPVSFCFSYSAVPLLCAVLSMFAFQSDEWQGAMIWIGGAAVTLVMTFLGAWLGRKAWRRSPAARIQRGLCPACGYQIAPGGGIGPVCSECGAALPAAWSTNASP
jgi:uncharacterized membrane protein YfcA